VRLLRLLYPGIDLRWSIVSGQGSVVVRCDRVSGLDLLPPARGTRELLRARTPLSRGEPRPASVSTDRFECNPAAAGGGSCRPTHHKASFEGAAGTSSGALFEETAPISRAPFEPGALPSKRSASPSKRPHPFGALPSNRARLLRSGRTSFARSLRTTVDGKAIMIHQRGAITRDPTGWRVASGGWRVVGGEWRDSAKSCRRQYADDKEARKPGSV
jgi:hypothetical protein